VAPSEPIDVNGEEQYVVEAILDFRVKRGKEQFLIKWEGYGDNHNIWELYDNMGYLEEYLEEFHQR
jgi:hypothetical protein